MQFPWEKFLNLVIFLFLPSPPLCKSREAMFISTLREYACSPGAPRAQQKDTPMLLPPAAGNTFLGFLPYHVTTAVGSDLPADKRTWRACTGCALACAHAPSVCPEKIWDRALPGVSLRARAGPPEGINVPLITGHDLPLTCWSLFRGDIWKPLPWGTCCNGEKNV